jgi:hypothetical protein
MVLSHSQEIPSLLWKSKVDCHIYKIPPPVSILSQINPMNTKKKHLTKNRYIIIISTPRSS